MGSGVTSPKLVYSVDPEYSDEAQRKRINGTCSFRLVVSEKGIVVEAKSIDHVGYGLDEKALEAIQRYRFESGKLDGVPLPVAIEVTVTFRM